MPLSLDGTGSITGIGTFNFSDEIVHVGDTDTKIRFPSVDTISLETAGSERVRIKSDGKVIIGDTNSDAQLGVYRASYNIAEFCNTNADATGAEVALRKDSSSPADGDTLGILKFIGDNDAGEKINYAYIRSKSGDVSDGTEDGILEFYTRGAGTLGERLRITSAGTVNIGGNYTQTTYNAQIQTGTNKFISFTNAAHDEFTDEASAIIFSRQSDGSKELSGIFEHSNTSFGIATRNSLTLHAGGSTTYSAAPERLRIDNSGRLLKSGQAALTSTSLSHPVQIAADASAQNIVCFGRASDDISAIDFYEADKTTNLGEIQYRQDHVNIRHRVGDIRFATGGTTERLRIDSNGKLILGTEYVNAGNANANISLFISGSRIGAYGGETTNAIIFDNQTAAVDAGGSLTLAGYSGTQAIAKALIRGGNEGSASTQAGYFAVFTRPSSGVLAERLRISSNGDVKIGNHAPGPALSSSPTMIRYFGKKCMQGTLTSTTTLSSGGSGTFELGKIWNADDTSIELFITCARSDSSTYTTSYCKAFCQKVRGTGITDGYILRQDTAAAGFTFTSITSGGYSGTPSHGARVNVSGGVANTSYTLTCFYTAISKNDFYS